ncbi:MAG TPA: hypothetical protein VJ865_02040 [Gemmatimonadaceae bacterium]|nr:hypothetical protein [Gemmatimonadaceae bacterium]
MPEWDGVERRRQKPEPRKPYMIGSLLAFGRKLWLEYLRRGIARPADLATMAAELGATPRATSGNGRR